MNSSSAPILKFGDDYERIRDWLQTRQIPYEGHLEITYRCNLKCVHCSIVPQDSKSELTFFQITEILDQVCQEGCLWLCLSGGEPLLREDFFDIYTYAKKKGFLVTLFTNGTLMTSELADQLAKFPPRMIELTWNGIRQDTYERITQIPGSFQKCLDGIHLILDRKLPLTIKSNGMTLNRNEILTIKDHVEKLEGVSFKFDSYLTPKMDGSRAPCELRLSPKDIVDIENSDESMCRQRAECAQREKTTTGRWSLFPCLDGGNFFSINPYGQLQYCPLLPEPNFDLLSLSFSEAYRCLRQSIQAMTYQTKSKCKDCNLRSLCPQCPARAWLEQGDREAPVDEFCRLAVRRMKSLSVEPAAEKV